jgi:hypothetical protein
LVGISSINGEDASENETSQAKKFEKGRWYKIRVRVTKERLETWIDDEQMVDLELEGKRIAMRPGEIESSKPFGIATIARAERSGTFGCASCSDHAARENRRAS